MTQIQDTFARDWKLAELAGSFTARTADDTTVVLAHWTGGQPIRIRKGDEAAFYANALLMGLERDQFNVSSEEALAEYERLSAQGLEPSVVPPDWSGDCQSFGLVRLNG